MNIRQPSMSVEPGAVRSGLASRFYWRVEDRPRQSGQLAENRKSSREAFWDARPGRQRDERPARKRQSDASTPHPRSPTGGTGSRLQSGQSLREDARRTGRGAAGVVGGGGAGAARCSERNCCRIDRRRSLPATTAPTCRFVTASIRIGVASTAVCTVMHVRRTSSWG